MSAEVAVPYNCDVLKSLQFGPQVQTRIGRVPSVNLLGIDLTADVNVKTHDLQGDEKVVGIVELLTHRKKGGEKFTVDLWISLQNAGKLEPQIANAGNNRKVTVDLDLFDYDSTAAEGQMFPCWDMAEAFNLKLDLDANDVPEIKLLTDEKLPGFPNMCLVQLGLIADEKAFDIKRAANITDKWVEQFGLDIG